MTSAPLDCGQARAVGGPPRAKILIVDDLEQNRRSLEALLRRDDLEVIEAESGRDALELLLVHDDIALALLDVQMPDVDGFMLADAIRRDPDIAGAPIVMLTSAGRPGDSARCRQMGMAAYLTKPVRREELRDAILLALQGGPSEPRRSGPASGPHTGTAQTVGRILVVESNNVTRLVARRLLENRGYAVVATSNGADALALLETGGSMPFGCLLLDMQMPVMDGTACSRIIRDRERLSGLHLPIIAMSFHGPGGDEAQILAAGLDGHLSKPIKPNELFDIVEHHLGVSRAGIAASTLRL